jgi:hypothetical protein
MLEVPLPPAYGERLRASLRITGEAPTWRICAAGFSCNWMACTWGLEQPAAASKPGSVGSSRPAAVGPTGAGAGSTRSRWISVCGMPSSRAWPMAMCRRFFHPPGKPPALVPPGGWLAAECRRFRAGGKRRYLARQSLAPGTADRRAGALAWRGEAGHLDLGACPACCWPCRSRPPWRIRCGRSFRKDSSPTCASPPGSGTACRRHCACARISDLHTRPHGHLPGIQGWSGRVDGDQDQGTLQLELAEGGLEQALFRGRCR